MITVPCVNGADDGEAIEHCGLFGKVLADHNAGKFGLGDTEGPAIDPGTVGLAVPRINVAGAARHPEQNNAFAAGAGAAGGS